MALLASLVSIRRIATALSEIVVGTISALFGLSHEVIDQAQYSYLAAVVIGSAVVPTLIANAFFLPCHLLPVPRDTVPAGHKGGKS